MFAQQIRIQVRRFFVQRNERGDEHYDEQNWHGRVSTSPLEVT